MATAVVLRSGGRRFLAQAANTVIYAEVGTAAILVQATTTGRSSSLAYAPRFDSLKPVIHLTGNASHGSATVDPQVKTVSRRLFSASGGFPTHHGSLADTGSTLTIGIIAFTSGGTTTSFARVASFSGCSSSRSSTSYKLQVDTKIRITLGILVSSSGVSPAMSTRLSRSCHLQTYAGEFRGHFSSRASPYGASQTKETWTGNNNIHQVYQMSADAIENTKPEICKCDAVVEGLEKIDSKIGEVSKKIDGLNGKIDQNIADGRKLKMEVELLKSNKPKGSGDWTSVKIRGKTLNWLSVGSAVWEFCKAYFK